MSRGQRRHSSRTRRGCTVVLPPSPVPEVHTSTFMVGTVGVRRRSSGRRESLSLSPRLCLLTLDGTLHKELEGSLGSGYDPRPLPSLGTPSL